MAAMIVAKPPVYETTMFIKDSRNYNKKGTLERRGNDVGYAKRPDRHLFDDEDDVLTAISIVKQGNGPIHKLTLTALTP